MDNAAVSIFGETCTAGYGMHERGSNEGWHRRRSHLVAVWTHPVRTLVGTGIGAPGALADRAMRR